MKFEKASMRWVLDSIVEVAIYSYLESSHRQAARGDVSNIRGSRSNTLPQSAAVCWLIYSEQPG
jgi:hypothetical protein